jgi:hypothetical protein
MRPPRVRSVSDLGRRRPVSERIVPSRGPKSPRLSSATWSPSWTLALSGRNDAHPRPTLVAVVEVVRLHQGCCRLDVRGRAEIPPAAVPKYGLGPTRGLRGADTFHTTRREDPFASRPHFPPPPSTPTRLKTWRHRNNGKAVSSVRPPVERRGPCPRVPRSSLRNEPGRCR